AFLKAQLGAGTHLPKEGRAFLSIKDSDKGDSLVELAKTLQDLGLSVVATRGTAAFLKQHGVETAVVPKLHEGGRTIVDEIKDGLVQLVMNTTDTRQSIDDSRPMRTAALMEKVPYFTTLAGANAAAMAMKAQATDEIRVRTLQ